MPESNELPQRSLWRRCLSFVPAVVFAVILAPVWLLLAIILVSLSAFATVRCAVDRRRLKSHLRSRGRTITRRDLRARLQKCEGTVIEEIGPKGPYRVWWTDDDLLRSDFKPPNGDEVWKVLAGQQKCPFNDWCCNKYIDTETGKGRLTDLSPRMVVKLAREFPTMKTVPAIPKAVDHKSRV